MWLLRFQRIYHGFIAAAPGYRPTVSNVELQDNLNGTTATLPNVRFTAALYHQLESGVPRT